MSDFRLYCAFGLDPVVNGVGLESILLGQEICVVLDAVVQFFA